MDIIDPLKGIIGAINSFWNANESWRFAAFIIILLGGISVFEFLFLFVKKRFKIFIQSKGYSPDKWKLSVFKPSFRLAFIALIIRLTEPFFIFSHDHHTIFRIIEYFFLALAIILVFFEGISLLDMMLLPLPEGFRNQFPKDALVKFKRNLKIAIIVSVAAGFLWVQKDLLPEWIVNHFLWKYLIALVAIDIIFVIARETDRLLSGIIISLKDLEEKTRFCIVLKSTLWPIRLFFITLAVYMVMQILDLPLYMEKISDRSIAVLTTLAVVLFAYSLIDVAVYQLTKYALRDDNQLDLSFVQMFRIISRVVVIIFGSVYLIQVVFGKPMSTLLAGLGIGGLAVALAAQDTLKNFFGSIMIMLDKPFIVGQVVKVEDHQGTVEKIGFRSTRIRTLDGHLIAIPNEKVAVGNVDNITSRPHIRRLIDITITYDTPPDKVERAVSIIKEILDNHEGMHPDFPPKVFFDEFNDVSLNIKVIYWYYPPAYWDFMAFSEKVNFKILRAFEAEGIEFAFPTTTTYLAQDNKRPLNISLSGGFDYNERPVIKEE
ncbi:MAG: mechanosensitive ion channel family protein [Proteobacteria bacterium]|nr:mechanosensitive ion channel family protein [Pseudomonadota bacterium]